MTATLGYKISSLTINTKHGEVLYENFSVFQSVEMALELMKQHHPSWTSFVLVVARTEQ